MANLLDARIGGNLREMRSQAGLSIDALATLTGLQPATLAGHESGLVRVPVDLLLRLAALLGAPVEAFFA